VGTTRPYDIAVVGGGIVGAAAARDAVLRGLRVVLLERGDWASGTTGRAAGLIHSGLRFARDRKFHLALECLREREILHRIVPHLIRPLPVIVPAYRGGSLTLRRIRWGFRFYDWLSMGSGDPVCQILSEREALRRAPVLAGKGLLGAGLFYDFHCPLPSRLVLEHVLSAREQGADCRNYHEVERIRTVQGSFRLEVREVQTGRRHVLEARAVINAAGAWADELGRRAGPGWVARIRILQGAHLWIDADLDTALWCESFPPCFAVPRDGHVVAGWHLRDLSDPSEAVHPDVDGLREWVGLARARMPGLARDRSQLLLAEAGAWAVPRGQQDRAGDLPCRFEVIPSGGPPGFVTLAGGNLTLFRRLAEYGVDAACRHLGAAIPGTTDRTPLVGGGFGDQVVYRENLVECMESLPHIPREVVDHLVSLYGRKACDVIELGLGREELRERLGPGCDDRKAQVVYAVHQEGAQHLDDVLLRRLGTGLRPDRGLGVAEAASRLMARELGWDEPRRRQEQERFEELVWSQIRTAQEVWG